MLRLFLYAQRELHFVAFNNLPLQASTPRDTFFPTLFVPLRYYLPAAAARSERAAAANFFQLLNTLILPFSLQLKHYIAVSWSGRCCVAVESIAEGIPAQRLACQSGLCAWKEGRRRKSQNTRGHQHGKAGMLGAADRAEPPVVRGNMCWVY